MQGGGSRRSFLRWQVLPKRWLMSMEKLGEVRGVTGSRTSRQVSEGGEGEDKARCRQERCETGKLDLCDMKTNLLPAWLAKGLRGNPWGKAERGRVLGHRVPISLGVHREGQDRGSLLVHTAQAGGQEGRGSEFPHPPGRVALVEIGRPCVTGQRRRGAVGPGQSNPPTGRTDRHGGYQQDLQTGPELGRALGIGSHLSGG